MTIKISSVVSAFNEEKNIEDCLRSLLWTDEIILVDNSSTDKTIALTKKYTSKIFKRPNYQMLNINKNFGFKKAKGDWILNLDADERVSEELKSEILKIINQKKNSFVAFEMPRKNIIFGKWIKHGIWWPDYQTRLFKKEKAKFPCYHVHEKIKVQGQTGRLINPLIHYNYHSITQFVRKMNEIYTENEAENLIKEGRKIYWYDALRMPVNDFLANFFSRGSYKDGLHGLVLSLLQAFYAFLIFAKAWEKQKFWQYNSKNFLAEVNQEVKKFCKDYYYWLNQTKAKNLIKSFLKFVINGIKNK